MGKSPFTESKFFEDDYKEYIKIFIIRNPLYVFSSLNKRTNYIIDEYHSLERYIETAKMFINFKIQPSKNVYIIRYEDLFDNNYQQLNCILHSIGLEYNENIFNNTDYTNQSHSTEVLDSVTLKYTENISNYADYTNHYHSNKELINDEPLRKHHELFRNWQVKRPFVCYNDISNIDLTELQKEIILNNEDILTIYPDIKSEFYAFENLNKCKE